MNKSIKTQAIELINKAHSEDPKSEDGKPAELIYSERMVEWLYKMYPEATELHEIAVRCQHLYRWKIKRSDFPMDKKGYHQWRIKLYHFQAEEAGKILEKCNYSEESIAFVKNMVAKKDLRKSEDTQILEDTACLVFLNYYFKPFAEEKDYSEEKWIKIIQKTWNKMSERAHQTALNDLHFEENHLKLIQKALA